MRRFFLAAMAALPLSPAVADPAEPPLKRVQLSRALYQLGLEEGAPLYLLAAARLRRSVPLVPGAMAPEGGSAEAGPPLLDAEAMLDAAAPMIRGDAALEGLAEDIRALRNKGVRDGPVYSIVKIRAGGKDRYPALPFSGGKYAEIYVEGAPGTDLNLMIHDAKSRLVCSDTDISTVAYCGWHPKADGKYTVTVVNAAGRGGRYSLMSN